MRDVRELLDRQQQWQRSRQALTWAEKIHMAESIRESVRVLRASAPHPGGAAAKASPKP